MKETFEVWQVRDGSLSETNFGFGREPIWPGDYWLSARVRAGDLEEVLRLTRDRRGFWDRLAGKGPGHWGENPEVECFFRARSFDVDDVVVTPLGGVHRLAHEGRWRTLNCQVKDADFLVTDYGKFLEFVALGAHAKLFVQGDPLLRAERGPSGLGAGGRFILEASKGRLLIGQLKERGWRVAVEPDQQMDHGPELDPEMDY